MDPKVGGKQHKTLKNTDDKFIVLLSSEMNDHEPLADPVDRDADEVNSNAVSEHENDRDPPAEDEVKYNVSGWPPQIINIIESECDKDQ